MANAKDTSTIPRLVRTVPKDDSARLTACLSQKGEPGICLWFPCKNIFCFRNPGTDYTPPPPTLQAPRTHAQRVSSRTRSVFHRAGRFLHSEHPLDAGARVACSVAPVTFSVLHAQRVSSRRKFSPFCKCAGRGRTPLPFRSFLFLIFRSERVLRSAHEVCSIAPGAFFRSVSRADAGARAYRSADFFICGTASLIKNMSDTFSVPRFSDLLHQSLSPFCAHEACSTAHAVCLIAGTKCLSSRRRFSPFCKRAGHGRTLFPFRSCVSPCQKLPPPYKRAGRKR